MGYTDSCVPDTGNVRAPLDVRRNARTVQAPVWTVKGKGSRWCWSIKLVAVCEGHSTTDKQSSTAVGGRKDTLQDTKGFVRCKEPTMEHVCPPALCTCSFRVWHAYKFVVTHTFWLFWAILTYLRKGLLRPGTTICYNILSYPKLIVMEKTIAALMLATPVSTQGTSCNCNQWS